MCCITFNVSIILLDGPIKQYYFCILREPVIPMSYEPLSWCGNIDVWSLGGNDFKDGSRYYIKRTVLANSNIGLLVTTLCHSILKTPNMFIHPPFPTPPHPTSTAIARHCEVHVGFCAWKLSSTNFLTSGNLPKTCSLDNHMISTRMTKDKGNLAVVECNCKLDGIERWLRNWDSEGNNTIHI